MISFVKVQNYIEPLYYSFENSSKKCAFISIMH